MCMQCEGWTAEEFLDDQRAKIAQFGWSVVAVGAGEGESSFAYTVGLTRYEGHPELLVAGLEQHEAAVLLNDLGAHVREGHRFAAGDVVIATSPHRMQVVRIKNPQRLVIAQEIYGCSGFVVPGLQVAWTDCDGRWPWDPAWATRRTDQTLFGTPVRAAGRR